MHNPTTTMAMENGMSVTTDSEPAVPAGHARDDVEDLAAESDAAELVSGPPTRARKPAPARRAILFGLVVIVALSTLLCWLGFRVHQSRQVQTQRGQLLQVARQGALNLTTIDWRHADADVRRILDSATGEFYNDFSKRSTPFIEVLQQAKATTVGTITEAGLESQTPDTAQALVAVSVLTSNAGEADPVPRVWRMRITVQKIGDQVKVCNVGFVQ
ncbi:Mce associated membrane protein [Mycobacterium seoulense]|uniref:Mce associated membrane protein n=2 Tax=Mycobacterium seoulense TaxID=386911 RepID=A0A7I7NXB4_9MYCO|nr:Mce associated membrane protein [Mycobacterium seoulense]